MEQWFQSNQPILRHSHLQALGCCCFPIFHYSNIPIFLFVCCCPPFDTGSRIRYVPAPMGDGGRRPEVRIGMICRDFILEPYPGNGLTSPAQITGSIVRCSNRLSISYQLQGTLHEILIPARDEIPARRSRLWEETCFELFLAPENSEQYWEFNLSPAGHWNAFRFSSYRQSMQEETAFSFLPFSTQRTGDTLLLHMELDAEKILKGCGLEAGISAIIKTREGEVTFWSLAHNAVRPDFHARDCFIIHLPMERNR